jgi:EAL domain-containing protein (putative c-di-GMP-specific phosphodiesterase class I)
LTIVLQPIVDLMTDNIVGYEALARFEDPDTARVFENARNDGTIRELDLACISKAFEILPRIPAGQYMSVNFEPATLIDQVQTARNIPVDQRLRLVLELSEQTAGDVIALYNAFWSLRNLGIRYAVDDVGSMFGNVFRVAQILPDFLKLDAWLVHGIMFNTVNRVILRAIVAMALELRATVVAEGIETKEDVEGMLGLGVFYGQGFFLGRPKPADEWLGQ